MPSANLYPLIFSPIYKEKVWGGRTLAETLNRDLPAGDIGESWEIADLGQTSVSGGGGGAERSVVQNGPLTGKTLHEVLQEHGPEVHGTLPLTRSGEFPLLVKYLDARQNLSVQVHPSPDYAATHDHAFLKSEAWYIVDAKPGAVIYKGVDEGVTPDLFRKALEENQTHAVEPLLLEIPVKAGDCHYLPSGTCHALGEGILVAEVQTPSDTTFRVFDWGREGRELHVDAAMQCIQFSPPDTGAFEPGTTIQADALTRRSLVVCEYFTIEEFAISQGFDCDLTYNQPVVLMFIEGHGKLIDPVLGEASITPGTTMLVPPNLAETELDFDGPAKWLKVTFPQANSELIAAEEAAATV